MLLVKQELLGSLAAGLDLLLPGAAEKAAFESPKAAAHGDLACTAAMQLAKPLKQNPRQVADSLRAALLQTEPFQRWVEAIDIAGPGFLNIRLKAQAKQQIVREVLAAGAGFGTQLANGMRMMVEFVSANPTGPLHVGHGRAAAIGDSLARLFEANGWEVLREFYYNDAGAQIDNLARSVQARARGLGPDDAGWPNDGYRGDYIVDLARAYLDGASVEGDEGPITAARDPDDLDAIRRFAVACLRREQLLDLAAFGVRFDVFFLESSLYTQGRVEETVQQLVAAGHTYEEDGALWLRSTAFGDDKDRVMRKSDGSYTYFVPDVAYHFSKWQRGYVRAVTELGADHHGSLARVRAGLQALDVGIPPGWPEYVLHQMVTVMRGGEEVKLSKRAGSYLTLRDLIDEAGCDATRWFLIARKPDSQLVFDIDLARSQSNDNPVFYVQYAHARICSLLRQAAGKGFDYDQRNGIAHLHRIEDAQSLQLMQELARFPEVVESAAALLEPHAVAQYLRELAYAFHTCYHAQPILVDDAGPRDARLALSVATRQVLANGLQLLGVSAPESM